MLGNRIGREKWKPVTFDIEYTNEFRLEVSYWGRIRSFNKLSDGRILNGSLTEGYKVLRLRLFAPREEKVQLKIDELNASISKLYLKKREKIKKGDDAENIQKIVQLIDKKKANLSKRLKKNLKERTNYRHLLIHRLVAANFLPKPKENQVVVGHLDFDKLNNAVTNLKWMTLEENQLHQNKNPNVIFARNQRKLNPIIREKGAKLTSTQVMHIKLQLKRARPVKQIAKQYDISDMQVWRIKSGENWGHVKILD